MSYTRHHAIIVTSGFPDRVAEAHAKATFLGAPIKASMLSDPVWVVSDITHGVINGVSSFFIAPDGSKEGWPQSDRADLHREAFVEWLDAQRHDDDSTSIDWVEVEFGDDGDRQIDARVLHDSNAHYVERRRQELADEQARRDAEVSAAPEPSESLPRTAAEWGADVARLALERLDGLWLEADTLSRQFEMLAGRADVHGLASAGFMLRHYRNEMQMILASRPVIEAVLEQDIRI